MAHTQTQARALRLATLFLITLCVAWGIAGCADNDESSDALHPDDTVLVSQDGHFQAQLTPMPDQPVTGKNMVHVKLMDAQNVAVVGASIEVSPWMPAHGHGVHEDPSVSEDGEGLYTISNLVYTMPGHWELKLDITSGQTKDSIVAEFDVQ